MKEECFQFDKETQLQYAMKCLENSPDGVYWSDSIGNIVYVNNAACKELGYTKEELLKKSILDIDETIKPDDLGENGNFVKAASSGEITHLQSWHKHRDGHLIPIDVSMGNLEHDNNALGFSFVHNISDHINAENKLKEANSNLEKKNNELKSLYNNLSEREKQLEYLAFHDTLTGLPNRTLFKEDMNNSIKSKQSKTKKSAILFIDIDNFKNINDGLGHSIGDIILKQVSARMSECLRSKDSIYRFGGDEFIILLQNTNSIEEIHHYSENIKNSLLAPLQIGCTKLYLSCSIGVSLFPDHSVFPEELLMYADTAMYKAKANGKNRIQFFNAEMKKDALEKMNIQNKLRQAISNHELNLVYQPQFNNKTGRLRGIEALARWNNPELGSIAPGVFIPIAEESGSIFEIGKWVMNQACTTACRWVKDFHFDGYISVNISAKQLKNYDFIQTVKEVLAKTGINPKNLELEITESVFIDSYSSAISILADLKSLGIRICLDDFGTGYSSLGYLIQLPIDTLKIDKSFTEKTETSPNYKKLTNSLIKLVNELGIETIVEGVETEGQLKYLTKTKADSLQGYLLSRPVAEEKIGALLQKK